MLMYHFWLRYFNIFKRNEKLWTCSFTHFVCDSASLKNKRICPDGSYALFWTCGLHNCTVNYNNYVWKLSHLIDNSNLYIIERLSVVSTSVNEPKLALLSKQTDSFYLPRDMRRLDCCPCPGLGLPRSCSWSKSQTQLINHTDTHQS